MHVQNNTISWTHRDVDDPVILVTLHARSCGAVYCNRSCLWVCGWVCYDDNSKLRASVLTKLGL